MRETDRFRTTLSLLGVAIGIFAIVAALTVVDSVQKAVRESFDAFGSDILFVDREPLEPDLDEDGTFRWWEYAARPEITYAEYKYLRGHAADACTEMAFAAYGTACTGVAGDWRLLARQPLQEGRYFTEQELAGGTPVVLLGSDVERSGSMKWIDGTPYRIIGVFSKAGAGTVSPVDIDRACLVPYKAMRGLTLRSSILIAGADEAQVRTLMRQVRRIPPGKPDDFALNRLSFLLDEMTGIFRTVSRLGWIVGLFSLLVGGFGVANILYVSVEERKPQIGLCRALGARRRVIEMQFLKEAVLLTVPGGLAGIALVWGALQLVRIAAPSAIELSLSLHAALSGIAAAVVLGLLFGAAPARSAARLDPVTAMRV